MSSVQRSAGAAAAATKQAWQRAPERGSAILLRVMTWVALALGRRVARVLLYPITLYFVLFSPRAGRQSRRYLERALGRRARFVDWFRHLHTFTATILDRVYFLRRREALFDVRIVGGELVDEALAAGRGAFLVGAHVGSFEAIRAAGEARGLRAAMVMYPDNARLVNAALRAIAPGNEATLIALGRPEAMLAVRDWLDAGGLAGMLGDRALESASERGGERHVQFLGQDAPFGDGPLRLAALLRRRVIFMAGVYLGGKRYEVRFEPLADFTGVADAAGREARIAQGTRDYAARLEAVCREHPFNWFNFHDFWREDGR
jgi:predicted LPLAT superfamily acyltransferase